MAEDVLSDAAGRIKAETKLNKTKAELTRVRLELAKINAALREAEKVRSALASVIVDTQYDMILPHAIEESAERKNVPAAIIQGCIDAEMKLREEERNEKIRQGERNEERVYS